MTLLINGVYNVANTLAVAAYDLCERLYEVGVMRGLYKCYSVKALMNESKIFLAFCELIDPDKSLPLGSFRNTFENVKAFTYGTAVVATLSDLINNIWDGGPWQKTWQKTVSLTLLLISSGTEAVKFFQKQFGIEEIPVLTDLANQMGTYRVFQGDYNPLAFALNRPKDAFYFLHCVWNIGTDCVKYIETLVKSAPNQVEKDKLQAERDKLLSTKNIIDRIGDMGKIFLITQSASYGTHIVFRVANLGLQCLGQLKTIAYD